MENPHNTQVRTSEGESNDLGRRIRSSESREWVITVDATHELVHSRNRERCIYKIPNSMESKEDEDDVIGVYRPCRVSLGPYHHGDERCREGEQVKKDSLDHFLRQSATAMEVYCEAVFEVAGLLRGAYDELDPVWEGDADVFVNMMIVDGCFLLELLRAAPEFYVVDNPVMKRIFYGDGGHSELQFYRHDVLLLQNQLPMRLLHTLLAVSLRGTAVDAMEFLELHIVEFFPSLRRRSAAARPHSSRLHLLDAYRSTLVSEEINLRPHGMQLQRRCFNIPTAGELHNARIKLRPRSSGSPISFKRRRDTLCLPTMVVGSATKSALLNTIAFEKLHCAGQGNSATAYLYFMQRLIHSAEDVRVLQSRGVIVTELSADEVARLFRRIFQTMSWVMDPDRSYEFRSYAKVGTMLRERYERMSDEWRKDLFQNYLRSPWAIVSVFAATLIFTLTTIQTVYTVLGYVNRK